ncbi:MAG: chromate transporter [Oscillospiraceae bacterium]|nr:chromate transporter [Oscillospiraceae bacterium]
MRELLEIFIAAFRVGIMTFGGGYAMLPILQREVVDSKKWVTEAEVLDYYAIGQCLPGIIMVNTMIFIGQKRKGTAGGIVAALGTVFPALVIITVIAALLNNFADSEIVKKAFAGIRVCVCVLIFNAVVKLWKSSVIDKKSFLIFLLVAVLSLFTDITPVIFVLASAVLGIILHSMGVKRQ